MRSLPRPFIANLLAALALASAFFALPASCSGPQAVAPSELVGAIADRATELREAFEEHREWYGRVELDPTLGEQERDDAGRLRTEISELLEWLRTLQACQKDGWSRETVFISDLVGQLEAAVDLHVLHVSAAETQLALRVEEGVYAIKVGDLLNELDGHIEALRVEAEQRPSLRCGRTPMPSKRRKNVPLI